MAAKCLQKFGTGTLSPKRWKQQVQRQAKCISVPKRWQKENLTQCLQAFHKPPTASLLLQVDQKASSTDKGSIQCTMTKPNKTKIWLCWICGDIKWPSGHGSYVMPRNKTFCRRGNFQRYSLKSQKTARLFVLLSKASRQAGAFLNNSRYLKLEKQNWIFR